MKSKKVLIVTLVLLVVVASLYRIIPGRAYGFAPQLAMAFFAGVVIKDRKWAFILPVLSMFISDMLYQFLFTAGLTEMQGFYEGQWQNYLVFAGLVSLGFLIKKINIASLLAGALATAVVYFLVSNFVVWAGWQGTRGLNRPLTWEGLMMCYTDAIPFFRTSVTSTLFFSVILFGTYYFLNKRSFELKPAKAIKH